MATFKAGWTGGTKTEADFLVWKHYARLHPEMQRRVMALIVDSGYVIGIGESFRTGAQQDATFRSRYTKVAYATNYWYDGSYWAHTSGAAAAVPGNSYHEPCVDLAFHVDTSDATGFCVASDLLDYPSTGFPTTLARYGLRNFSAEPWHVQPVEYPAGRAVWNTNPFPLSTWPLPNQPPTPPAPPPSAPIEDDMTELIQPANDAAIFLRDGLICTWVADGNVLAALTSAGIVGPGAARPVTSLALKALELHGPAPTYGTTPTHQPGRTSTSDFAAWRP